MATTESDWPMTEWKNVTSYHQGEDSRALPRTFEIRVGKIRLVLTKHRDFGQEWTIRAPDLGIAVNRGLGTEDENEAKVRCVKVALSACKDTIDGLTSLLNTLEEMT